MADPNPKFMAVSACSEELENGIAANSPDDIGAKLKENKLLDCDDYSDPLLPPHQKRARIGAISTKVRAEPDIKFDQLKKKRGSLGCKILEDSPIPGASGGASGATFSGPFLGPVFIGAGSNTVNSGTYKGPVVSGGANVSTGGVAIQGPVTVHVPKVYADGGAPGPLADEEEGCSSDQSFPDLTSIMTTDPKYFQKFGPPLSAVHGVGITGRGIKIAIIDCCDIRYPEYGTMKGHMALKTPNLKIRNMTTKFDKNIGTDHALMCTAIAVGQPFNGYHSSGVACSYPGGVAPGADATLFLVNHGDSRHESLDRAFKEVAEGHFDVVSLSFGGPAKWMENDIKKIQEKNTIVVAAAGNGGNWEGVLEPASFKDVVSVGSLDTFLNKSTFSPKGEHVDIYFHGEIMVPISDDTNGRMLGFSQGTSMATPGIAGLICLLLQCAKKHDYDIKKKEIFLKILKKMITTITTDGITYNHPEPDDLLQAYYDKNFIDTLRQ